VIAVVDTRAIDSIQFIRTVYNAVEKNRIDFRTLQCQSKSGFLKAATAATVNFNAFIRIRKDSVIWVSIIAALGIRSFQDTYYAG